MLEKQIVNYRNLVVLKDGTRVLLRALTPDDKLALLEMYEKATARDTRNLRDDVKNPEVVTGWCDHLDYNVTLPILAIIKEQVVGQATLYFRSGPQRHVGEVRIFLNRDYRRRGLGTKMLQALIELARKQGLYMVVAEVVADQIKVIKAFQSLGFEQVGCTLEDYFMYPDGDTTDVALLILYLNPKGVDF